MSDRSLESTSALFDDHCDDHTGDYQSAVAELLEDPQRCQSWHRYALIGQVMRKQAVTTEQLDISAQVFAEISKPVSGEPVQQEAARQGLGQWLAAQLDRFLQPVASVGIAAAVAVVTVISVQQPGELEGAADEFVQPAFATQPFAGNLNPVSLNTVVQEQAPSAAEVARQRQLLQAYMLDHQRQLQLSLQAQQNKPETESEQSQEATAKPNEN
ncbi:RseA family anti-sigma factor [Pseudidiomarina taiwanensis]|uniref:Anti-sigma-E factor RseA n=1 Tax=Pseudidiomarina taiwanensis TaxID=337250 RepID=A0A432ZNL2_9GAMM|nr:RseA family anti-sigma factor [Pseudidiomarina taiwanensis]RUO79467.1 hypothetical protein CWI83_02875 [Pseudidiomarina taiwanensis]